MTEELFVTLDQLRSEAAAEGLPVRRTDGRLYHLLAKVYGAALEIDRTGAVSKLEAKVGALPSPKVGANRSFLFPGSDVFILASRYVLTGVDNRNSVYRYAKAMRGAADRQIAPVDLPKWLSENGGLRELLKPVDDAAQRFGRVLTLGRAITYRPGDTITLTIRAVGAGYFDIVKENKNG